MPEVGLCPIGSYCPDGKIITKCPDGKYGRKSGAANETDGCVTCPQGFYCPLGQPGYPTEYLKCSPGHFCPDGTKTATEHPCPDGTFSRDIGNVRKDQCEQCLPG